MRIFLRSLAALDFISLIFMSMQLWEIANHFNELEKTSEKVSAFLMFPMFLLVLIGAIGLVLIKKFGFIFYYIQFPFRIYLWVFTIGFITVLPEVLGSFEDNWFDSLLKVCVAVEFIRLYTTIRTHIYNKSRV